MKSQLEKVTIEPNAPILKAIEIIDHAGLGIVLVVSPDRKLLGTVTDGDIRRGILKGVTLNDPTYQVMNDQPLTASPDEPREVILERMKENWRHRLPVVDADGTLTNLLVFEELLKEKPKKKENCVVLMAGGLGLRLKSLTKDRPKPLLEIGNRPVLETILMNFIDAGFYKFYLSVNYKAEMIQSYFGDGSKWDVRINYLHEEKKLGTIGALSLLPETPLSQTIVMNGDLLTKVNFDHLLQFHTEHRGVATVGVREYDFQVPYGIVKMDQEKIKSVVEKPVQRFFVNGGIYVFEPEVIQMIPKGESMDAPALIDKVIKKEKSVLAFPIREYWLDIGHESDFKKAENEFTGVFS